MFWSQSNLWWPQNYGRDQIPKRCGFSWNGSYHTIVGFLKWTQLVFREVFSFLSSYSFLKLQNQDKFKENHTRDIFPNKCLVGSPTYWPNKNVSHERRQCVKREVRERWIYYWPEVFIRGWGRNVSSIAVLTTFFSLGVLFILSKNSGAKN